MLKSHILKLQTILKQLEEIKEIEQERLGALGDKEDDHSNTQYGILENHLNELDSLIVTMSEFIDSLKE